VAHNLGQRYPAIEIFNNSGYVIIPSNIQTVDNNNLTVTFSSSVSGIVSLTTGQGTSGSSGTSGRDGGGGSSGSSGTSGSSGSSGTSGSSGSSGTSGTSGSSGSSGTSGTSGSSGSSGTSGSSGSSGTSGTSGSSGSTGTSGTSGTSGSSGTAGTSGTSGYLGYTASFTSQATWSVTHSLGVDFPLVTIWDSNRYMVIPSGIKSVDTNTMLVYFSSAQSGNIIVGRVR
jgi:hypothetical protein